ncbi:hypothetical protein ABTY59_31980 [Streptomyces sp. NPDC096079]|uniref:hypothetical protein n=1 Tax=Streptomyces sp. NPDC096079 TaxID=3155820 RepID=UPI00331CEF2C
MSAAKPTTGIANADELLELAYAFDLTVDVQTKTTDDGFTSHVVRISIPVPPAYAGTELGRLIAAETLTLLWTRSGRKGSRGRLDDATRFDPTSSRKLRTLREVRDAVEFLGHESTTHARATAPLPEEVVDAPHTVHVDGRQVHPGLPADNVRHVVKTRRAKGWGCHQDETGTIHTDNGRSYVPLVDQTAGAPATPVDERRHVRTVDGGTPQIISTRDALAEMNDAMMKPGQRHVREMSAAGSRARIVYRDAERGTVELRPATAADLTTAPAARPASVVLATDPIPVDGSVLTDMPGESVGPAGVPTRDAVAHDAYVAQERNGGAWQLPNHDNRAHLTRADVIGATAYVRKSSAHARVSVDTDGTVYVSNGYQAARYIPASLIADCSADLCPGCSTPYASNGDGPCTGGRSLTPEERQRAAEKDQRRAHAYAGKWWAEQGTDTPTDDALRDAFQHCTKPPRPKLYPAIRDAIAASTPPVAAAPLFAAHAAYESVMHATSLAPSDIQDVAHQLEELRRAAPRRLHAQIHAAAVAADAAWPLIKTAGSLAERNAAYDQARDAVTRARAAILAVAPRAHRMHGTDLPATDTAIRAAARAYNAYGSTSDELIGTEYGPAVVRVRCRSDRGSGWTVTAVITAGVNAPFGFLPAHPPLVVKFTRKDGRLDPAESARRLIGPMFKVDVPVEYENDRRV